MHEILLFIVGIIVGAMNAVAGGGMLVGFPVLLMTGMPAIVANATTTVIVIPGQLTSVFGYRKFIRTLPRRYLILVLPLSAGAAIGTLLLRHTSAANYQKLVPVLVLMAIVLFIFQPFLHNHAHRHITGPKKYRDKWHPLLLLGLAFLPIAVYGGFFGTGIGFIMLAFLGFTNIRDIHRMTVLKNLILISVVVTNFVCLFGSHLIDYRHGLAMAAGTAIGGYMGARSAQRVSSHAIRIVVIVVGLGAAVYLALSTY